MTRESLARKFKPAGFDQPEGSIREYTKPRPELQRVFYKWLEDLPDGFIGFDDRGYGEFTIDAAYERAVKILKGLDVTPEEANGLLLAGCPEHLIGNIWSAGAFLSVVYNRSGRNEIVFDLDAEYVRGIGFKFGGKITNKGNVGGMFGYNAKGPVINDGECGSEFGARSKGPVINNGIDNGPAFGEMAEGPVINNNIGGHCFGEKSKGPVINNSIAESNFGSDVEGFVINNARVRGESMGGFGESAKGPVINNGEVDGECGSHADNIVINNGDAEDLGRHAHSPVINNGTVRGILADYTSGHVVNRIIGGELRDYWEEVLVVNNGIVNDGCCHRSRAVVVAIKDPESYGTLEAGLVLKQSDCEKMPELKKYFDRLKEISKSVKDEESAKRFLEVYGPKPKEKIERDVEEILRRGGFVDRIWSANL